MCESVTTTTTTTITGNDGAYDSERRESQNTSLRNKMLQNLCYSLISVIYPHVKTSALHVGQGVVYVKELVTLV